MLLHEKLKAARERRGLSPYAACQRMIGVGQQQLLNLERRPGAQRTPKTAKVTIHAVVQIVSIYWPDIQLEDFFSSDRPQPLLRFAPLDPNAARKLKGFAPTG
ncbi:MAG: hypothetical protein V3W32_05805 [Gemmatimonadota bacterium]